MKKLNSPMRKAVALAFALVALSCATFVNAETIKKLRSSVQLVVNTGTGGVNDVSDATTGLSSTIDLSGGDLQKLSFGVYFASGTSTGNGNGTIALEISPNGGTNWLSSGYSVTLSSGGTTGQATGYFNVPVGVANKARLTTTLSGSTTWYSYRLWALPSVD